MLNLVTQMKIPIYQVDASTDKLFHGNPAAVCPLEDWLPDTVLQAIAEENNLSETAFFVKKDEAYELRWFTPVSEVDLCGHATLATAHVLFANSCKNETKISFSSKSGPLQVLREDDLLTLDFPATAGVRCDTPAELISALGINPIECYKNVDYMIVLENENVVADLSPDFGKMKEIDLRGVMVTAPGDTKDFVSRFFAPKYGIDEDPVTGSAHCTLAPYWAERLGKNELTATQISKRTGNLICRVERDRVFISGKTVSYLHGEIEVTC